MRKVRGLAVIYALILALPFTMLAACTLIYLTDYITGIGSGVTSLVDWSRLAEEGLARWPELAGLVAGQLVILSILLITRRDHQHDDDQLIDSTEQTPNARTVNPLSASPSHTSSNSSSHSSH